MNLKIQLLLYLSLVATVNLAASNLEAPADNLLDHHEDGSDYSNLLDLDYSSSSGSSSSLTPSAGSTTAAQPTLTMVRELRNVTKEVNEGVRLRCEVKGDPPARWIKWFMNEAPVIEEQRRVKVKTALNNPNLQYSVLKIRPLESLDTGFYRCEAGNDKDIVRSNTMTLKVEIGTGSRIARVDEDSDYIHVPDTFDDPFASFNHVGQVDGLPSHIEFQGKGPDHFDNQGRVREKLSPASPSVGGLGNSKPAGLPSLKPDEKKGSCQKYTGSACAGVLGNNYIFISADQDYIEKKLAATFAVIGHSPEMSSRCAEFAIPAICHSTFPLCDLRTKKPRKLCRDECDVLEHDICKTELAIAKSHPMIGHQMGLPECTELPPIGSRESHNCVRLDIPNIGQLIQPHSCYTGSGETYRGTHSMTRSGATCRPWADQRELEPVPKYLELVGGHNYCRNPDGGQDGAFTEPWCWTDDPIRPKETCGIPACTNFSVWLYIVLPASVALVLCAITVGLCCLRQANKKPSSLTTGSPRSFINPGGGGSNHNYSEMEMNHLLPAPQTKPRVVQAREFEIGAVRFEQEIGEAPFGKVYRGQLGGLVGGMTSMVAVKTLKSGANQQTRELFQRESEIWADLRHPNIICLLGVVTKDTPRCLIYEWPNMGDLHEYLLSHSPKSDIALSSIHSSSGSERVVDHGDMSYLAMQIASGMEYLVQHQYVHRDLAARNILMGPNLNVKISDLGLSRDKYAADYYRMQSKSLVPLRWMAPESIFHGKFCHESDVWEYGVLLWEIYSYGLQPYYGYSNQEVIEMLRSRQLLPCPEECPSRMYAFMVECWHEFPARRPSFTEIHARLRQWESMSCGYQSTHSNSQCGQSDHSNSQHSSTGPSNNTGSTSLSQQQQQNGYAHPYSVQVNQGGHHLLLGQNRTYTNMYSSSTQGSSLQMV